MADSIFGLADQVALVTGAAMGAGRGCALMFARAGAHVAVVDIDKDGAQRTAKEIQSLGRKAVAVVANLRQDSEIDRMLAETWKAFGRLDICVNNIGGLAGVPPTPFLETTPQWVDHLIAQNLRLTYLCCLAEARLMVERKVQGRIINIASVGGMRATGNVSAYGAAKAGIINLTQHMAVELSPHGIRVNAVAPGTIATERHQARIAAGAFRAVTEAIPLKRLARPEDIGGAAVFLASDLASYITGQLIVVDGGITCTTLRPAPEPGVVPGR